MRVFILNSILFCLISIQALAQYSIIGIPPGKLKEIKIDGNINDWDWVPENYIIRLENLMQTTDYINTRSDYFVEVKVGWSNITNCIYIALLIQDNELDADSSRDDVWLNDKLELGFCPAYKYGEYFQSDNPFYFNTIKDYFIFPSDNNKEVYHGIDIGPIWMKPKNQFYEWAIAKKKTKKNKYEIRFEIKIALWKAWDELGPEYSDRYLPMENEVIKMFLLFGDRDHNGVDDFNTWRTLSNNNFWRNVGGFSDFKLGPILER